MRSEGVVVFENRCWLDDISILFLVPTIYNGKTTRESIPDLDKSWRALKIAAVMSSHKWWWEGDCKLFSIKIIYLGTWVGMKPQSSAYLST